MRKKLSIIITVVMMLFVLVGCSVESSTSDNSETSSVQNSEIDTEDLFSERDLQQEADLSDAKYIEVSSGNDVEITEEGVYVLSGDATDTCIVVNTSSDEKVQLVLDGLSITNESEPCIYVKNADKVFITTTQTDNALSVEGEFTTDGDTNTDAVIFSKDTIVLNGVGTLSINSTKNAISSKDSLKVTGGEYIITCSKNALEAKDIIGIYDGTFNITSGKDAIHCENEDDDTKGLVYIENCTMNIDSSDDGIQGNGIVQIDGGTININSSVEGIEGTYILINDGTITINASDDGLNGSKKSNSYDVVIEINGGNITITMGQGDTDAIDVNGALYVNGGNLNLTGVMIFDFDTVAEHNGGTIIANGEEIDEIVDSMDNMMGGGFGGKGNMKFGGKSSVDGTAPEMSADGTAPEMPTDGTAPQMPTDGTAPQMSTDGTTPQMPTDGTKPDMPANGVNPGSFNNDTSSQQTGNSSSTTTA